MHCTGCTFMDFHGHKTIKESMSLQDIKNLVQKYLDLDIIFENLALLGGEPTLHSEFSEIVDYITRFKGILYKNFGVVTNGTNFNKEVIDACLKIDFMQISIYPNAISLKESLIKSGLLNHFRNQVRWLNVKIINEFWALGVKDPNLEYSQKLNWKRCWAKDRCRNLTNEGLFRCYVLHNICKMESQQDIIDYIERDNPFDYCRDCVCPPIKKKWSSNMPESDERVVSRAVRLIENFGK